MESFSLSVITIKEALGARGLLSMENRNRFSV